MANVDRPGGLRPFGKIFRLTPYRANGAIKEGDAVSRVAGTTDTSGRSSVKVAVATEALIGVAAHKVSAAGDTILVYDHPEQRFMVQASGAEINEGADIGKNYDLLATAGSGDYSAHELNSATGATTATLPFKLERILPAVGNELGEFVKCVVKINNHQLGSSTGTVGV